MNLVEDFLNHKKDNLSSELTIKNYRIDLIQFLPVLFNKKLEEITVEDLKQVTILNTRNTLIKLQKENGYTVTTINRRLASFKSFFKYWSGEYSIQNTIHSMRSFHDTRLREVEFIPNDNVKQLIEKAKSTNIEMYYVLGMLFNTGLRGTELLSLTTDNIHDDCIIVVGKGNKLRRVELNTVAKECIAKYIKEKNITKGKLLDIPYVTLRRHYSSFLSSCNIECTKLHTTRRSFATNLIQKGASLTDTAQLLGHSTTATLEKHYLGSNTKALTVSLLE